MNSEGRYFKVNMTNVYTIALIAQLVRFNLRVARTPQPTATIDENQRETRSGNMSEIGTRDN